LKTKFQQIISPPPPSSSSSQSINEKLSSETIDDIPSEFLDSLTFDLMLIPMLLPSGHLIDRITLEKCIAEDIKWSRLPRDPFTLESFTDITQPVVAQQLKIRIDQFLSEHQNDQKYRNHQRLLDANKPIRDINVFSYKRKYSDDNN
jgi:U-box domain-containing protein 5